MGVAVAGRGVPLVLVHGFSAEGFLYAQTLSRLVASGFRVIAVDTAGHGSTGGLPDGGGDLQYYAGLLGRAVDHLGVRRAVFAGHSMGGRLVTELVARQPRRGIAVVLVDAIVGDTWDAMVRLARVAPPLMGVTATALALDVASTMPVLRNPRQAAKLGRLWVRNWAHNVRHPTALLGPAVSMLRSGPTRWMLDRLAEQHVPVIVIHGDRDLPVPIRTARDTARRARGELVVVHGASHAWPLKDPETLPGILAELLGAGCLGDAMASARRAEGIDPGRASVEEDERAFIEPGALIHDLSPPFVFDATDVLRAPPRYRWTRHPAGT
ncbi:MAG: alpha/beta hydrolase [Actinomycetota bacterium]|nr:alpha/beta hydrolase [Actinomycetota bacterium]